MSPALTSATCVLIHALGESRQGGLSPATGLDSGPTPFTWTFRAWCLERVRVAPANAGASPSLPGLIRAAR